MRVLWMEIKCIKSAARFLDSNWVNKGGLDLSKEVLWVFVGQRTAELPAVKFGGLKKILPSGPVWALFARTGPISRIFCWPPTLTAGSYAALWSTETHHTFLERSKPPLLTQSLSKSLAALLTYFISIQIDLISIVSIKCGCRSLFLLVLAEASLGISHRGIIMPDIWPRGIRMLEI